MPPTDARTSPRAAEGTASPKAPRDRILAAADALFYEHGLRGVGIDRVIAESGVAKATMYAHFPSKDELAAEYLRRKNAAWSGDLRAAASAAGDAPADQLVGLFDALVTTCSAPTFRGCAFINAMAESEPDSAPHRVAADHKATVKAWVRDLAAAAGAPSPETLATQLTLLVDGTLSAGRVDRDPALVAAAKSAAATLVGTSLAQGPAPATPPGRG